MMSIVRDNLLNRKNYTPYCGRENCRDRWPRLVFNGEQFECSCGYCTNFEKEFIEKYKEAQKHMTQLAHSVT